VSPDAVNYDRIASHYHQRYAVNPLPGVAAALRTLVQPYRAARVLEVGCGSGRWLAELGPLATWVCGLDLSPGMLRQARGHMAWPALACGDAGSLPFADTTFQFVFCVNALHHFAQPRWFIGEARRLLEPGGRLAVVGMDPHTGRDQWYVYEYFAGTREADLARFPPSATLLAWMEEAGLADLECRPAEAILHHLVGSEVLEDYFLQQHSTSQLTLLTDQAYAAGLERIRAALAKAEAAGRRLVFTVDLSLVLCTGRAP
jgi:SAM-dependent methyltransferase